MAAAVGDGVKKWIACDGVLSWFSRLTLFCAALVFPDLARADGHPLRAELATGVLFFGAGPTPLEAGLSLDLGLSVDVTDYFVARVALGLAPVVDRHSPAFFLRTRAEGALQGKFPGIVPLLGAGGALLGLSPAVHGLLGVGFPIGSQWLLGLDVRSGLFWDRDQVHEGFTPFGDGQLRVSWTFK